MPEDTNKKQTAPVLEISPSTEEKTVPQKKDAAPVEKKAAAPQGEAAPKKEVPPKQESVVKKKVSPKKEVPTKKKVISKKVTAPKEKESPTPSGEGKCILIVEDERPLAHALELKFAHEGYKTYIAKDGAEALELIKKYKPHIILLDLIMPNVDGFVFLEEIKKTSCEAPIIVLTNLGQEEDRKRAIELGVKEYFVKSNTPITDIVKQVKAVT